jgi:hypothetical protein
MGDAFEVKNGLDPLTSIGAGGGGGGGGDDAPAVGPGCEAWTNGEVYATGIPARVNFAYEVALDSNADVREVKNGVEERTERLVGRDLTEYEVPDRRLEG